MLSSCMQAVSLSDQLAWQMLMLMLACSAGSPQAAAISFHSFLWAHCLVRSRALELTVISSANITGIAAEASFEHPDAASIQTAATSGTASPAESSAAHASQAGSKKHMSPHGHAKHAQHARPGLGEQHMPGAVTAERPSLQVPAADEQHLLESLLGSISSSNSMRCMLPLIDLCNHATGRHASCTLSLQTTCNGQIS